MFGVKIREDLFLTYGKFKDKAKAYAFGFAEFGDLCDWDVVPVNQP